MQQTKETITAVSYTHLDVYKRQIQDVLDPPRVGAGSAAGNAVYLISLLQKELCQIGTVLPGDSRYQCHFLRILTHYPNSLSFLFLSIFPVLPVTHVILP